MTVSLHFITPCSPVPAKAVPVGDGWLHEVKFDGHRVQAHKIGSRVVIYSRNGHDFTDRFPSIAQLLHELPANVWSAFQVWYQRYGLKRWPINGSIRPNGS